LSSADEYVVEDIPVRAVCPNCGEMQVNASDVMVSYCLESRANSYHFCCPRCTFWIARSARPGEALALARAGARVRRTQHPSREEALDPAPLTFEDRELIEFLRALET
jgi:predicted RNA-binding Zn-ribbon protein involved in translation (DUF1610 family)